MQHRGPSVVKSVFSGSRNSTALVSNPPFINPGPSINHPNTMDGLLLLKNIRDNSISAAFFDPQYRGIMDKMKYGNEGKRQVERALLNQMDDDSILQFMAEISRVLANSGHLFLWIDKFHLCQGITRWTESAELHIVDLVTWDKGRIGMGYRTRRKSEYLLILQKAPVRAKGIWTKHDIPDIWTEKIDTKAHPHQKPFGLQKALIESVSAENEYIIDPCAGSYSVLAACLAAGRNFIGSDLRPAITV